MTSSLEKPAKPKASRKKAAPDAAFKCDFCKRAFTTEKRILIHLCEPKRRYLQRDEKHVKVGFLAYQRFFEKSMPKRQHPSYEDFAKSSMYLAFVRFGRYLMNVHAINPFGFIDFLLRVQAPIDKWEHATYYETYVRELNKSELPIEALERNILLMQSWSIETGEPWTDFFRRVAPAQATLWIKNGRISPWILLTCPSSRELMQRLSPEQVDLVEASIDPKFWEVKIARHANDVETIRQELSAAGL